MQDYVAYLDLPGPQLPTVNARAGVRLWPCGRREEDLSGLLLSLSLPNFMLHQFSVAVTGLTWGLRPAVS